MKVRVLRNEYFYFTSSCGGAIFHTYLARLQTKPIQSDANLQDADLSRAKLVQAQLECLLLRSSGDRSSPTYPLRHWNEAGDRRSRCH